MRIKPDLQHEDRFALGALTPWWHSLNISLLPAFNNSNIRKYLAKAISVYFEHILQRLFPYIRILKYPAKASAFHLLYWLYLIPRYYCSITVNYCNLLRHG